MTSQDLTNDLITAIQSNAANSEDLYNCIKSIHQNARNEHLTLVYPNNVPGNNSKVIELMITSSTSTPIPLPEKTDFNGWTFEVRTSLSDSAKRQLFILGQYSNDQHCCTSNISKSSIDTGNFLNYSELNSGLKLLLIEDSYPWTYRNDTPDSYWNGSQHTTPWANWNQDEAVIRRDILLLKNGLAVNRPIAPYSTMLSLPKCSYVNINDTESFFKHIKFKRNSSNVSVINLLLAKNLNNLTIEDVTVQTQNTGTLVHDECIRIENATNVVVKDYNIDYTYSSLSEYGYGIGLNNVWNSNFINVYGFKPTWGVFGCNNVNTATLTSCVINRFDIHCYGRDVTCIDCIFKNKNYLDHVNSFPTDHNGSGLNINIFNRFSSFYGILEYETCTFDGFYPLMTDYTYNIYSGYEVHMNNCTMLVYLDIHAHLFQMGFWGAPLNARKEHIQKSWPNVYINGLIVKLRTGITSIYMFRLKDREWTWAPITEPVYNTTFLSVKGIQFQNLNGEPQNSALLKECNYNTAVINYAQRVFRYVMDVFYGSDSNCMFSLSNSDF